MKKLFFIFFLISNFSFSQKQYVFDYLIDYDDYHYFDILYKDGRRIEKKREEPEIHKVYYLINSSDNSYVASLRNDKDSLFFNLMFRDNHKKIISILKVLKSDIKNAEYVKVDCENIHKIEKKNNSIFNKYDFFNLNDTIINNKQFFQYTYYPTKVRLTKKKRFRYTLFMVDKKNIFHLPIFFSSSIYNKWLLNKKIPKGIFKNKLVINRNRETIYQLKRKEYYRVNIKIIIPQNCQPVRILYHIME